MAFIDPDEVKPAPSTGGGFIDPDEVKKQPVKEVGGRYHNIARTGVETVGPAAAGYAGFGAGMAAAAPVAAAGGAVSGPFAPIVAGAVEVVGGLAGAFVASGAAQKVQDLMHKTFAPEDFKQRQIEKKQHPYGTFAAQTAVNLAGMSPKTVAEQAGKVLTKPLVQRATGAALQTGIEAGLEFSETGKVDPTKLAMSAVAGAAMPGQNKLGEKLTSVGESVVDKTKSLFGKEKPVTSNTYSKEAEQAATKKDQQNFVKGLQDNVKKKEANVPVVEAAIKDKSTGEITRLGPKHPEDLKESTKDTHEQGFIDEKGNFLNRKEAWERAKNSGQIPKGQNPEQPKDGLHSGDLRTAGDKRFDVTPEQPAGVAKETPSSPGEPPVDRTNTNPRDVKSQQEFEDIAQEIYEKQGEEAALKFYDGYQEYKKTWADSIGEVEKLVGTNINSKEANERIVYNNTTDLKKMAGDEVNLDQLSYDIDKGTTLVGKAKEVATKFRELMDELGKRALEKGVIKGWHEDYVARNVVTEGAAPPGALEQFLKDAFGYGEVGSGGGTKTTTKYGEQRKLDTREDLKIHLDGINKWLADNGENYRFKLKTDNLADIYKDYALSVEKAIENKNLIENIKQIRNVEGESLIRPIKDGEPLPYGWKVMDNSELAGYAVHPDLMPHLKFVFDSGPGMVMEALGSISQFVKRINVVGSFFHAKSLMEVQSSANIPIWSPIKESIVLPLVEKGVKAFTGKDIQLSAVSKAVQQFREGGVGSSVDQWIREDGLQLGVPEDVTQGILSASGKLADTLIGKYGPKTRILEKSLSAVEKYTLGYFDKYTWDYLHTGIKLSTAEAYLDKARMQAAKEGKEFNESASRKEIAKFLNEAAGGLNWYQAALDSRTEFGKRMALAAFSPEGRRSMQIALFAPDWTTSTVRAFSSALPKELNPTKWHPVEGAKGLMVPTTKGDYARLYQFKTALTYFTLLNAINLMTANRPIWENKDPTRIEFPDGTSMQAMKHAMEPYHWIADPDKTLSNKLGFLPKAAIVGIGGLEYASPNAPKLVDRSALSRLGSATQQIMPFQVQAAKSAPEGEGVKRALLGTAGFPIYGSSADQKKAQRSERELATKEQAWNYRDKEIQAGRMEWTPKHEKERQSLEKRRQKIEQAKQ